MVDVTTLDTYQDKEKKWDPEDVDFLYLNVENAKRFHLLFKWLNIQDAQMEPATVFKDGKPTDEKEDKLHLYFKENVEWKSDEGEDKKGKVVFKWPLNPTNLRTTAQLYGTESDDWVGMKVKLRVQNYPRAKPGLVVISREELDDMGETPPTSSSKIKVEVDDIDDPEVLDMTVNELSVDVTVQAVEIVGDMMRNWPESEGRMTKDSLAEYARGVLAEKGASQELKSAVDREITGSKRIPTE